MKKNKCSRKIDKWISILLLAFISNNFLKFYIRTVYHVLDVSLLMLN